MERSKPKLTVEKQLEHMKDTQGILFNIVKEEDAMRFLETNNYFFKIKSYAKNFEKYTQGPNAGKYYRLEFSYLKDLSIIDMLFRRVILSMCIDIEHFLKVHLLAHISNNSNEDGYNIVTLFLNSLHYDPIPNHLIKNNSLCANMIQKYKDNFAAWNIVEVLSFGDFVRLYRLYFQKGSGNDDSLKLSPHLSSIVFLRNATAHNNCLLHHLRHPDKNQHPNWKNGTVINYLHDNKIAPCRNIQKQTNIRIIHELSVLLYVFNSGLISDAVQKNGMDQLDVLLNTNLDKYGACLQFNSLLLAPFEFLKKVVALYH